MEAYLESLFSACGIKKSHIRALLANLATFEQVFTAREINPNCNYEWLEQVGDTVHTAFIVHYFYERMPNLKTHHGQVVVSRLRIKYAARAQLARFAEKCGMWNFICASDMAKLRNREKLLEDVFEAFVGALFILGTQLHVNGQIFSNQFLKHIYDAEEFDLNRECLVDAITRLKEWFDSHKDQPLTFTIENDKNFKHTIYLDGKVIGVGVAMKKKQAEQIATEQAIKLLGV